MALEHKLQQNPRWVLTEIIAEILLKLPVESLLRCKSVCKQWYSLISNQRFIKSHLTLAPCNTHCRLISLDNHSKSFRLYDHVMFGKSVNVVELDNPFTAKKATTRIIGSCNGLLCIISVVNGSSTIFFWNPSTRRVNRLPSRGEFSNEHIGFCLGNGEYFNPYVGFGFGYDESNDDYKVVEIISGNPIRGVETRVMIYSLKSGYWKRLICDLTCFLRQPDGMFFNGALHWITVQTIVSFDLATETFGEILQPVYDKEHYCLTLCTFGEWLSVVCSDLFRENRSDVWVMKVYGVQDSWTKLVSIPHQTITELPLCLMTLCITQDGKILLKLKNKLVLYDPKNSSLSEIQKIDTYSRAYSFVESLVSPMPARSRDTHGLVNSIILRFKKICAPGHIWSCLMPIVN
ncbi:F-box associated domain containing protein [Tanacetum coccineum]